MRRSMSSLWWRDSNQTASGKPGAVQYGDRYARHNIRMNNLLPGFCENVNLSEFARKSIPAQRPATFEEIGQACVFLASDGARYINGQSILSDGGMNRAVR